MAAKDATPDINDTPLEARVDEVADALEEEGNSRERYLAERLAKNYAPPLDPGDPRPREVKEAIAREAMGIGPTDHSKAIELKKKLGKGTRKVNVRTSAQVAADEDAARAPDYASMGTVGNTAPAASGGVIINGTHILHDVGPDVELPQAVAEIHEHAANPIRTEQMRGGGLPLIDLRSK